MRGTMRRTLSLHRLPILLSLGLALSGCPKPPTDLLKKAREALSSLELAKKCAPEAYRSALKMYEEAEELNKKKAYKEATQAAEAALKLAEAARKQAEENKKDCERIAAAEEIGKKPGESAPPGVPASTSDKPREVGEGAVPSGPVLDQVVVYFAFNRFDVQPESARILTDFVTRLAAAKMTAQIEIEGHCDARGSVEYNLALGERRAKAVRDFLVQQGIAEKNVSIISYGAERPAVEGSTEEAHAKNRRAVVLRR
jgi:peptidoglycan-associated lipoprotein